MTRNPDHAGSVRRGRAAGYERAGAEVAGAVIAALLVGSLATTAAAQDAPPAAPADSVAAPAVEAHPPSADPNSAAPTTPPADPNAAASATPAADPNAVAPADPNANAPQKISPTPIAPRSEARKTEAAPSPKAQRAVKRNNVLPSKVVAGSSSTAPAAPAAGGGAQARSKSAAPATGPLAGTRPKSAAETAPASAPAGEAVTVRKLRDEAKTQAPASPVASIEERTTYQYNTLGRRDPFEPMIGSFVGEDVGGDAPPDVGGVTVVGIVWGADAFALVEDGRGNSLILRRGDKVMNGYVEELKRDAMIVKLTVDGQSQSVAIPLTRKGDQSNANR